MAEQKTGHQDRIIDAEVEPAAAASPPPATKRRPPLVALVAGVVVLALLVGAAAWWRFGPANSNLLASGSPPPAASSEVIPEPDPRLDQLQRQLEALAARPDQTAQIRDLEARLTAAEQKSAALERQLGERNRDDPTLGARVDGLVRALGVLAEAREQATAQLNAAAVLLAVGQLRESVLAGRPYEAEIAALRELEDSPEIDDILATHAAQGVQTRAVLVSRFAALPSAIVAAGGEEGGDVWSRIERWARRLVTIRPLGETGGDDPAAIAARAEARVAAGDLAAAVAELSALKGPAAAVAASWRTLAERRLAAERALGELQSTALAQAGETRR
jgi:hypothetical protein